MNRIRKGMKRASAIFLSAVMSLSVFSAAAVINADAATYSELSALDRYAYTGNDLGANYSSDSTTFKVWSPTASSVKLKLYTTGSDSESGAAVIGTFDMTKGDQAVWSYTASGDLAGTYYTYLITNNGTTKETVDIYARTTGVNGKRGMVIDLESTDPTGWENDHRVECKNQTDAIIWEAHVRDFSSSSDSGMTNKGKYLAFTETGTTVNNDGVHPTGVDYLADLGITHVHLLPVYDYASVDETNLNTDQFNWGYDPMNYNTPEGSYSTNPYKGEVRVKEFKQMVQSLHNKGIGVVMDVVYNHTYSGGSGSNDWFDYTVPGYYYRQNADGSYSDASGCGNETASDRAMYEKFMIDSLKYWATEYHLDGFRFDLMGVHDTDTMNHIRSALDEIDPEILIYGEPWTASTTTCPKSTAVQGNMKLVSEEIAAFNDKVRDAIKGSCFNAADKGFIQGAGYEEALKVSIQANSTDAAGTNKWSKQPSQTVTYTSAHDNYTLYDKLVYSVKGGSGYGTRDDALVAMNKMAGGIILTSQGISFFQAGEEFARSKYGDENSYKSSTSVNQLKWANTITYSDIVSYYKGLIEIRKAYSPFRDPTNNSNDTLYFSWGNTLPSNVVGFTMYNTIDPQNEWNYVGVIHNANSYAVKVDLMTFDTKTLPSQWVIIADGTNAGLKSLGTSGSTVNVPARSTVVLVDKDSFESVHPGNYGTVTVNHIIESNPASVYKTETLKGSIGSAYNTAPLSSLLDEGYALDDTSGNTSGVFTKEGTTVNYYYRPDFDNFSEVQVCYLISGNGGAILGIEKVRGKNGTTFNLTPKSFDGYEFDPAQSDSGTGVFGKDVNVNFVYNKVTKPTLKVHYYNSNGWADVAMYVYDESVSPTKLYAGSWPGTLMTAEGNGWYVGEADTTDKVSFIANNNVSIYGQQDPSGYNTAGYSVSGEVYIKDGVVTPAGKVVVSYYDISTGLMLDQEILTGYPDGTTRYTTTPKTFEGYKPASGPTNASGVFTADTIYVNYLYEPDSVPLVNTSTISKTSFKVGESVTITGSAQGGVGDYTFDFYYKRSTASSWTKFGRADSAIFAPQSAGTFDIKVVATDSQMNSEKMFTVEATADTALANNTSVSKTNFTVGEIVKVTGAASGGTGRYTYEFYYKRSTASSWTRFGSNGVGNFKPGSAGTFVIRTYVKDGTSTKVKDFNLTATVSGELSNNTTVSKTNFTVGEIVKVTGAASGGTGRYTYEFYYKRSTASSWTRFGSNGVGNFKPGSAGTFVIRTYVKDGTSTKVKDFNLTASSDSPLVNNTTVSATDFTVGEIVKVTGAASGGTGSYTYEFYYKRSGASSWTRFGSNGVGNFKPGSAGTFVIRTYVKDGTSTKVKDFNLTAE